MSGVTFGLPRISLELAREMASTYVVLQFDHTNANPSTITDLALPRGIYRSTQEMSMDASGLLTTY